MVASACRIASRSTGNSWKGSDPWVIVGVVGITGADLCCCTGCVEVAKLAPVSLRQQRSRCLALRVVWLRPPACPPLPFLLLLLPSFAALPSAAPLQEQVFFWLWFVAQGLSPESLQLALVAWLSGLPFLHPAFSVGASTLWGGQICPVGSRP